MASKPTVEQFIHDCFRERTEALKRALEVHREFRKRFYHDECRWDSRRGVIEDSEGGKILEISATEMGIDVITTGFCTYCARYRVRPSGGSWLIQDVEIKCGRCQIKGTASNCAMCGGTGWQSWKVLPRAESPKRNSRGLDRNINPAQQEETGRFTNRHSAIEQFMTHHCRERTVARRKEAEIHAAYRRRFYSPECGWDSKEQSGEWIGEAETIINIAQDGSEVFVIAHGFTPFQLRYHLRPERQNWLIWEVDTECLICYKQGASNNCFWCGGTIWEHKKSGDESTGSEPPGGELL